MTGFRLTVKAKADLHAIGRYTESNWGRSQRNKYLAQIDESFRLLAREPDRGRLCDEVIKGYRKYPVGKHYVFYREAGDVIEIVRILHERMNMESHLAD